MRKIFSYSEKKSLVDKSKEVGHGECNVHLFFNET